MLFAESTHCSHQAGRSRGRGRATVTSQLKGRPGLCVCESSTPLITEPGSVKACPEAGAKQPKAPAKQDMMQAISIRARGFRPHRVPQRESLLTVNVDYCLNHHVSQSYLIFLFFPSISHECSFFFLSETE